jgi:hypothetical protein
MVILVSVMLIYCWSQFADTPLFTMCVVTRILTANIDVYNTEKSSLSLPCPDVFCAEGAVYKMATSITHGLISNKFIFNSRGTVVLEKLRVPQLSTNPPLVPTPCDLVQKLSSSEIL